MDSNLPSNITLSPKEGSILEGKKSCKIIAQLSSAKNSVIIAQLSSAN